MATTNQVVRGNNVTFLYQSNNQSISIRVKSFSIEEEGTEGYDEVCGENRGRPFKVTDGFNIGFEAYTEDESLVNDFLAAIQNADASLAPFVKNVGFVVRKLDGTRVAYKASELTPRLMKLSSGSRTDALMFPSGFRAKFFESVVAA